MKEVKKIVEQRIEKHLDLVGETTDVINTIGTVTSPAIIENQTEDEKADNDFKYARENMNDVIEKGRDAMEERIDITKSEESPRAFEVFGQLLKNMTDAQEKLMDLHQKKNRLKSEGERQEVTKAQNVTNALFVGSTADLLKLVKKEANND